MTSGFSSCTPLDRQDTYPTTTGDAAGRFDRDGFAVFQHVVSIPQCEALADELTARFQSQQDSGRSRIGGVRNLLQSCALVAEVADSPSVKSILRSALGAE